MTHPYNPSCKMEGHAGTHPRYLTRDNIREIEPLLREIESPLLLGLQLDVPIVVLKDIEREYTGNKRQMIEVIDYWLINCTTCSWGALAEAVKKVGGHDNLAHKLNQKDSVCAAEPVIESMEMECSDPVEPMMVSVPIRRTCGDSSKTRHPEKRIGATKSCPNFLVVSGEETSGCRKLRSSSVSNYTSVRVTLNDSDFADDSSPSPTEMEIDTNESTSTPPKYMTVNAPTSRAKQLQIKHNMLQIIEELISDPDAKEFVNFVDKKRVNYYEKIYYPMCLDEIKGRINKGHCDTREKFCDEFYAIVENCETYYGSESEQAVKVQKLKAQFEERVEQHIPDDHERKLSLPQELELPSESSDSDGEESDVRSTAKKKKKVKAVAAGVPSEPQLKYFAVDAPTERGKRLQIKHNMLTILEELKRRSDAEEFIGFVSEKRAEDYYSVIDYPMCLNEIRDRINRYQCDSRAKFCDEFNAIIENCEKYNGPDSDYTAQARTLKARFDELVEQHVPDDSDLPLECALPNSSTVSSKNEESPMKPRSSKDKVTVEELMELRHADGRIHWKLPIVKYASYRWKNIAGLIGCHTQRMKALEEQYKDQDDCLREALVENFIQNKPRCYSQDWSGLAELLNDVGLRNLAERILAIYK